MAELLGATTALLDANTRAGTATQERQSQERLKREELMQSDTNSVRSEQGAMARTVENNKQAQFLQKLKEQADLSLQGLVQREESKRKEIEIKGQLEKQELDDYLTMTPQLVKGLKDTTGLDFSKVEGQRVRSDITIATIALASRENVARIGADAKTGKTTEDLNKELRRLENSIKGNRDKLINMSFKDIPEEAWGGEPGNYRKVMNFISAGQFGNLDATKKNQVMQIAGYANTIREEQRRANEIHRQLGSAAVDYSGMGLSGSDTGQPVKYNSAEEVKAAMKAGKLTRDQALNILEKDFKMARRK